MDIYQCPVSTCHLKGDWNATWGHMEHTHGVQVTRDHDGEIIGYGAPITMLKECDLLFPGEFGLDQDD
jgi:hypothetical protein